MARGSSPLARGLPGEPGAEVSVLGIIPARAGFTNAAFDRIQVSADHPRSRGVYFSDPCHSPPDSGIIPARAGFTRPSPPSRANARDHPRSRGVYTSLSSKYSSRQGSSPLARGLPNVSLTLPDGYGIIPARAGFTQKETP